ncbi:MAG: regulator [Epulopiscium sp. Nele67-Bin002]|nr:MAG: regulator [Epulopiscium sp. Nuni2H_MBin001]OON90567.1 MAG: regulator [Epulopiscium sp. Nele67-Bin001]OON91843.1 MAG: regulator [Epulopiscium sp. Nele67-Bin002]
MEVISTQDAPAAIGPYSQGMVFNDLVFTSGQVPIDPNTGEVVYGSITEQSELVMKNLGAVLAAGGSKFENAIKCTCFLSDMNDFAAFNEVYAKYFVNKPARSCVAVKTLPRDVLVEVECIAFR